MKYIFCLLLTIATLTTHAQAIGGIGAQLKLDTAKDGYTLPRITGIVPYSPSDAKNIPKDSYILRVNDYDCKNKPLEDVVKNIRGEVGTSVKLKLADNPEGKKAKEYTLVRATIMAPPAPPTAPPVDPTAAFYDWCGQQATQIRRQGHTIIKKFNSECGSFFFSFESENVPSHARLILMEAKGAATETTATFYDNSDENNVTALKQISTHDDGNFTIREMEATMTLKQNSVGVVKVNTTTDATKCKAMFIVVYK